MNKRLLTLAASFLCTLFTFAQFSGSGSGTENDPYLIYNETQLSQMVNFLNQEGVVFSLKKDLDLTNWIAENSPTQGWQPIGVESSPFKGKLLGNGKTISGLSINRSGSAYVGFFGSLNGATISNLKIRATSVKGGGYSGLLAGRIEGSTITNVDVSCSGTMSFTGQYSGGLIGYATGTNTISSVTVTGNVSGTSYVGGVVGFNGGTTTINGATITGYVYGSTNSGGVVGYSSLTLTIQNVTMTGHVGNNTSYSCRGGIIGQVYGSTATLSGCNHFGDVKGSGDVGGIIGKLGGGSTSLTSCKSQGTITSGGAYTGGVIGRSEGASITSIESCSHFGNITGTNYVGGIVGAITSKDNIPNYNLYYGYTQYTGSGSTRQPSGTLKWTLDPFNNGSLINGTLESRSINNCTAIGDISGSNYVGGLIGSNLSSFGYTIVSKSSYATVDQTSAGSSCYVFKRLKNSTGSYTYIQYGGTFTYDRYKRNPTSYDLTNSYYSGNITASAQVGGLVGENGGGNVQYNYSYGSIYGTTNVGGIVGCTTAQTLDGTSVSSPISVSSSIKSNMAICPTISASTSGAAVGRVYGSIVSQTTVGAVGSADGNGALTQCKLIQSGVTQTVTENLQNGNSIGPSLLKLKATYVAKGWNFNNNWKNLETECYPYKTYQAAPPVIESELVSGATTISGSSLDGGTVYLIYKDNAPISTTCSGNAWSFSTEALQSGAQVKAYAEVSGKTPSYYTLTTVGFPGSGTEADPYRVYSAEDLQGANKTGYYKLMNDIDLTSWINTNSPTKGWIPIGLNSNDATYIDGDNHKVTGLWTNTTDDYTGLFSNYSAGEIKNLTVEVATGKTVKGGNYTGILIGRMANGNITNCTVKGNVSGSQYTGGLAGYVTNTPLSILSAEGNVTGTYRVGGLVGEVHVASNVSNCSAESTVNATGTAYVGGLFGSCASPITQCHATATITATGSSSSVGGLVGSTTSSVLKTKADANITTTGANNDVGGLLGYTKSSVQQSFANGSVSASGTGSNTGGLVGYADGTTITNCYSTASVSGTDYNGGLVAYALNTKVDKCYAKGNISGVNYGAGVVAQLDGSNAKLSNSVAANNILSLSAQSSWGSRVLGGFKNGAPEPEENNYALNTMQVSLNGVPQTKTDDPVEGIAKTAAELMSAATYQGIGWNFSTVWGVDEGEIYPYLLWEVDVNPVAEITLDKTTLLIAVGKTETITANVLPLGATNKRLNWTSSNEAVATVDNGVVTAVAVGTANITATSTDGSNISATCRVTVTANKDAAIAELQSIVDHAQELYDNSTEGENIGEYAPGSRAALLEVINSVRAQISSTMSDEAISQCTADINAAIEAFESQKVTAGEDTDYSTIPNTIYLELMEAAAGSQVTLSVKMKNTIEVQGYQFDLYLPEGVTIATDEDGFNLIELSTERTTARKTDYFNSTVQADGSIRVLCGSSKGYVFEGNDGEVATITLNISEDMEEGDYPIILKEVNLTDKNSTLYTTAYLKSTLSIINFILGDVNGNKKVEVADFIATANFILGNPPQVFIFKAGDLNNNKNIEVSDFIGIANIILNSSTSSNAPAAAPKKGPRKAATDISTLTDIIYVEPVTATPGTQQTLSIQMKNSSPVAGFEFRLQLPEGITVATDEDDILMAELSTERTTARKTDYFNSALQADGTLQVLCGTSTANPNTGKPYTFSGNEGEVARITVNIPEDYADGVYEMNILDAAFSDADNNLTEVGQTVTTELTIGDNTIVLDEDSEDDIETTDAAVNIKVRRTIAANQWSTICLPFNMTAEQVYASFGDDVQLQAFDSYDVDYDDDDNVKSILVHFADIDIDEEGLYANYPYLIMVSEPVEEFTVRSILEPDEENAIEEYDNGKTGRQRKVYGTFYGTYHAQTTVPESCLFISNNKFWYSTGLTKMKAFRGYFEFVDVLADMANANISFSFDGTTGIHEILNRSMADGAVYTIQGQFVGKDIDLKKLPRGIYIINGKKQVIK